MKFILSILFSCLSVVVYAHQSRIVSVSIGGQPVTTTCKGVTGSTTTNMVIAVTFEQISNYKDDVLVSVTVRYTDRSTGIVRTFTELPQYIPITNRLYIVNLTTRLNLIATHVYDFTFDALVVYGKQNDVNANNASSLTTCQRPLPVELVSFTGTVNRNEAELAWVTANVDNFAYFQVESSNGTGFVNRGQVYPSHYTRYRFNVFINEFTYFRIKCVDFDKTFNYSPIIALVVESNAYLVGHGDHFQSFTIGAGEIVTKIQVSDIMGRAIYEVDATNELPHLPDGIFIINLITQTGRKYSRMSK